MHVVNLSYFNIIKFYNLIKQEYVNAIKEFSSNSSMKDNLSDKKIDKINQLKLKLEKVNIFMYISTNIFNFIDVYKKMSIVYDFSIKGVSFNLYI